MHGRKTYWTAKYPPIEIADTKYLGDLDKKDAEEYEKKVTRYYMKEKGINNVRGGDLTDVSNYKIRFGNVYDDATWWLLSIIILQMLIMWALFAYILFR